MTNYDNLRSGSRARLADYRRKAARSLETIAKHHGTESALYRDALAGAWRRERWVTPHGIGYNVPHAYTLQRADNYGGVIYADSGALDHLRPIRGEDEARDYGRGWYSDAHQSETITGRVVALPSRKGEPRFLAFAVNSGADGITIDRDVYTDPVAACHAADRLAERLADDEREYSEKWNEARELQDDNDSDRAELRRIRQNVAGQFALIRAGKGRRDAVCDHVAKLREEFAELLEKMGERRERLAELQAEGVEV